MVILFVFPSLTELQISACFSILGLPISLAMLCTHSMWDLSSPTRDGAHSPGQWKHGVLTTGPSGQFQTLLTLQQGSPASGMMIWGGADVIIIEIKCTVNAMLESSSNHPPYQVCGKIVFHKKNWPLVPKSWGPLLHCMIMPSSPLKTIKHLRAINPPSHCTAERWFNYNNSGQGRAVPG